MSGLVGNSRKHVLSCRGSFIFFLGKLLKSATRSHSVNCCVYSKLGGYEEAIIDFMKLKPTSVYKDKASEN